MPEITYASIRDLIDEEKVDGAKVVCRFRCPDHGTEAEAVADIEAQRDLKSATERAVKRGLFSSLSRGVSRLLGSTLGGGVAGQAARSVANEAMQGTRDKSRLTRSEVEAAVVKAFRSVESKFRWDEEKGRFTGTA